MRQTKGPRSKPPGGDTLLNVRIQPRASRNGILCSDDGGLKIRLTAPPVDNAANEALIAFLAGALSIAKSRIEIVTGHTARQKVVRISGMSGHDVISLLNGGSK